MDTTISGLQKHFALLYNVRNLLVNGSFHERACHFMRRIGRIADAERKGEDGRMPVRLARGVSYCMSLVNYFGGAVDLELGMMEKFPRNGCRYCGRKPCACNKAHRPTPKNFPIFEDQRGFSLRMYQQHLDEVYGTTHRMDFWEAMGRLMSEFGELAILNVHGPHTPLAPKAVIAECRQECADILGWLLRIAQIKGIDLQDIVQELYEVCPGCKAIPCECPLVFLSETGDHFSTVGTRECERDVSVR